MVMSSQLNALTPTIIFTDHSFSDDEKIMYRNLAIMCCD